jgi:hypothetical protein
MLPLPPPPQNKKMMNACRSCKAGNLIDKVSLFHLLMKMHMYCCVCSVVIQVILLSTDILYCRIPLPCRFVDPVEECMYCILHYWKLIFG